MYELNEDVELKQLEKYGFKKDNRKGILMSVEDDLFGTLAILYEDKKLFFYEFSDNLIFGMMHSGLIHYKENK